jgi:hypothetical protein
MPGIIITSSLPVTTTVGTPADRWDLRQVLLSESGWGVTSALVTVMVLADRPSGPVLITTPVTEEGCAVLPELTARGCVRALAAPSRQHLNPPRPASRGCLFGLTSALPCPAAARPFAAAAGTPVSALGPGALIRCPARRAGACKRQM